MSKVNQIAVSYRVGSYTSKVSVQPAIVEALDLIFKHNNIDDTGYDFCKRMAIEAYNLKFKKASAYVREKACQRIFGTEMVGNKVHPEKIDVRVGIKVDGATNHTTITMFYSIIEFLKSKMAKIDVNLTPESVIQNLANEFYGTAKDSNGMLSQIIREKIIANHTAEMLY